MDPPGVAAFSVGEEDCGFCTVDIQLFAGFLRLTVETMEAFEMSVKSLRRVYSDLGIGPQGIKVKRMAEMIVQ